MKAAGMILLAFLAAGLAFPADLSLAYETVWSKFVPQQSPVAIRVTLSNKGADTQGLLKVGGRVYPVELPRGANKSIQVYSEVNRYYSSEGNLKLETPTGVLERELQFDSPGGRIRAWVGTITDNPGSLAGLRNSSSNAPTLADTYCLPIDAPDRSIGYGGISLVVLSRGSERLGDASVAALKRYVLRGGALMFCGGASPLTMRDSRWADVLPFDPTGSQNVRDPRPLAIVGKTPLVGVLTVSSVKLSPGSEIMVGDVSRPFLVRRQVGLGRVYASTFDLFEDPARTWAGRAAFFGTIVDSSTPGSDFLASFSNARYPRTSAVASGGEDNTSDPFNVKLATPGLIFGILGAFLVVAVPINFFVLAKLKRRELAWVTLPMLSLLFSGVIFGTASGLYSAKAARSTSGVLIVHDGLGQGLFVGSQQLFFPHSGKYDLGFHDVEEASPPDRYDFGFGSPKREPDLIDIGQVVAPALEVPNLAFREYSLTQAVDTPWKIGLSTRLPLSERGGRLKATLTNSSPYKLRNARLFVGHFVVQVGDVDAGGVKNLDSALDRPAKSTWRSSSTPSFGSAVALEAQADFNVGSTYGYEVTERSHTELVYTWPLTVSP